jgi:thymidylate synthase ThyX
MKESAVRLERVNITKLDEILGLPFNVLDDGHVRVIDYMGSDEAIVQAARVSYGKGTKKVHEDRGLIRYLMRHRHSTPFEMCELKIHVRVPMDHWRQWIRHRTACLSGDTTIHFDLPGGLKRGGRQLYQLTLKQVYAKFQPTRNATRPDKQKNPFFKKDRLKNSLLRSLNEDTLEPIHTKIVDIWESGEKEVFEVTLENGSRFKSSKDHLCFTGSGWKKLDEAIILPSKETAEWSPLESLFASVHSGDSPGVAQIPNVVDESTEEWKPVPGLWSDYYQVSSQGRVKRVVPGKGARSFGRCKKPTMTAGHFVVSLNRPGTQEVHFIHKLMLEAFIGPPPEGQEYTLHKNGNNLDNCLENLRWGSQAENSADRVRDGSTTKLSCVFSSVKEVRYVGVEMTYDLEVEGPYHNFVAGGVVVHNSVNEYSTRYSEAIDSAAKTPSGKWRVQSGKNKQGSSGYLPEAEGAILTAAETSLHNALRESYEKRLEMGVAREQARKDLPLSTYTEAYWKIDLLNLLHFLSLRMDAHAQEEIRSYATVIGEEIVRKWVPIVWEAFLDYRLNAMTLSRLDIEVLRAIQQNAIQGEAKAKEFGWLEIKDSKLVSNRERDEFEAKANRLGFSVPWITAT